MGTVMQQLLLLLLLLLAAGECQVRRQQLVKSLNALVSQARGDEDFDDFDYAYDFEGEEEQERRKGKQVPGLLPLEECETAGFERRQREECQEVPQPECNPVNVTKYRTEIVNKCKSIVDRECHVVDEQVPKEECVPSQKKVCHIAIRIEDEEIYDEVCNTIVKNICADPYHSPEKVSPYPTSPPSPPPYPPHTPHPHPPPPPPVHPYKLTPIPTYLLSEEGDVTSLLQRHLVATLSSPRTAIKCQRLSKIRSPMRSVTWYLTSTASLC